MIQDIEPRALYNHYDPEITAREADTVLMIRGSEIMTDITDGLSFPKVRDLADKSGLRYLFSVDEERYFLAPNGEVNGNYAYRDLRALREKDAEPQHRMFAAYTGKHLADWYRDTRFCGRCGAKTVHSATERAMTCPACGYTAYPRIMPAVIVGVKNGSRLLLTRYRTGFAHNALIAGFTEIGETLEQTAAREVMEEAGVRVKNITYYKSQPWGTANDILAGFYCEVDGDDTIRMDEGELKYAEWVEREDIVLQPNDYSLTNEMMKRFRDGKA